MSRPKNRSNDLVGKQIDGFEVRAQIAARDTSVLYLVHDTTEDHPLFLEIMTDTVKQEPLLAKRFRRRMETVARLPHPNIGQINDVGVTSTDQPYAAGEYFESVTLAEMLANLANTEKSLSTKEALQLVRQLADALAVAHAAGIVHHDLRPENIRIRADNTPVLIDLGIEPEAADPDASQTLKVGSDLDYRAPEQLQGKGVTQRSNIYSIGIVLYEMLAGHRPEIPTSSWDIFQESRTELPRGVPLEDVRSDLSLSTYELVRNCLWREEWNRYETAEELRTAIDEALVTEQARTQVTASPVLDRRRLLVGVPAGLLVILLIFFLLRQRNAGASDDEVNPTEMSTTVPGTVLETATATPIPPATELPAATPAVVGSIDLLAPPPGSSFQTSESVFFDWFWPQTLEPGQHFTVQLIGEEDVIVIGTIFSPIIANQYRLQIDGGTFNHAGSYNWQVNLETADSEEPLLQSEKQPITFIQADTPTPEPTATSQATSTLPPSTPTQAATFAPVCSPAPPPGWVPYSVRSGDALFSLGVRTGTTVERIEEVNCLENSVLSVGMELWLPFIPATETPIPSPTPVSGGSGGGGNRPPSRPTPTPPPP